MRLIPRNRKIENCRKEISKRIPLLQQPGKQPPRLNRSIFQGRRRSISVHPTHGDAKEGPTGEELGIRLGKAGGEFKDDEKHEIRDERPFSSEAVAKDAKDGGADGPEHERQGDSPRNRGGFLAECVADIRHGERNGEEIKGILRAS